MWKLHSQNRLFTAIRQWCRQGKFTYAIFSFDKTKTYANFTIECTWFQNSDFDWSHTIRRKVASSFFAKRCVTFLQWRVRLLFLYALLQFCITEKNWLCIWYVHSLIQFSGIFMKLMNVVWLTEFFFCSMKTLESRQFHWLLDCGLQMPFCVFKSH